MPPVSAHPNTFRRRPAPSPADLSSTRPAPLRSTVCPCHDPCGRASRSSSSKPAKSPTAPQSKRSTRSRRRLFPPGGGGGATTRRQSSQPPRDRVLDGSHRARRIGGQPHRGAWRGIGSPVPGDTGAAISVKADSLVPTFVFARGSNLDTQHPELPRRGRHARAEGRTAGGDERRRHRARRRSPARARRTSPGSGCASRSSRLGTQSRCRSYAPTPVST